MARTNPHHDWPEPKSGSARSNGAEWESLRNELVALLDQVEDQVASAETLPDRPQPAVEKAPAPMPSLPPRHSEALRSVRQAVARLADRGADDRPVMRESVVETINKIRARQTGANQSPPTPAAAVPAEGKSEDFSDFAKSLDAMGERIGRFESQIAARLDTMGDPADVSAQIGQLSDVIELLANAVGETGQIRRLESQIANLAETLATERAAGADGATRRIEDLTSSVERLVNHQIDAGERMVAQAAQAEERQARSMDAIEQNVRSIYDRIDALEATHSQPSAQIDRLSQDMAALAEAVTANREPQSLLDKIDALSARIETIDPPSQHEGETLAHSVAALRDVITDTIEPRFAAMEEKIAAIDTAPQAPISVDAIEAQLRQIAQRVDETSAQLRAMAETPEPMFAKGADLDMLVDRIVERTRNAEPVGSAQHAEGVEKADLAALEQRLASLFARTSASEDKTTAPISGVKTSIAQVDGRIARLEAMLNTKKAEKPSDAEAGTTDAASAGKIEANAPSQPIRPRRKPNDAMPLDPATGSANDVQAEAPRAEPQEPDRSEFEATAGPETPAEPEIAAEPERLVVDDKPFTIDPETIERPAKPQSSFAADREHPFETRSDTSDGLSGGASASTRSNFIEAARRSARQQPAENDGEAKSLIARALARFQRNEAEQAASGAFPAAEPVAEKPQAAIDPVVETGHDDFAVEEKPAGFISRNRRALLLGTALVVVIALTIPLVLNRTASSPDQTVEQAQLVEPATPVEDNAPAEQESAAAPEDTEPTPVEAPPETSQVSAEDDLMSGVRVIEQQPSLSAARVDATSLSGAPLIDPVQTAAISPAVSSYADDGQRLETPEIVSPSLPEIAAPAAIEPEALRLAAEAGDMHAQFEVGAILTEGTVVEQDLAQAAAWYERSAAQGFAPAQYRLGSLYESGNGVERDLELARLWYQRAAEAGNRMSMHNLASLYAGGELASQDFAAAAHWFEQAAGRGLTDSQFNLGMLYARGLGVDQDFEQSYIWFSLAARSGDEDAASSRDDVARSLEAETVQRLDDTVDAWTPAQIEIAANFAPIGTWDETFDPGPALSNSDVVLRVQMLLAKLGYDIGTPDGIAGPKTREAIASFEDATGMSESGEVNPRLLAVLGSQPV